jgi:hypothetical protein
MNPDCRITPLTRRSGNDVKKEGGEGTQGHSIRCSANKGTGPKLTTWR